jgi:hypothetical protein
MFRFLRALDLDPIEWTEAVNMTGQGSPYVGTILDVAFAHAQAIMVVMTPDDEAKLRDEFISDDDPEYEKSLTPQARPNVLFEAGLAFGRKSDRTILVEVGRLRPFSDIGGRHVVRLDNSQEKRQDLANRLKTAGCQVDISGTDWLTEGDFILAVPESLQPVGAEPQPTLVIEGPVETNMGQMGRGWGIRVRNRTLDFAEGCHGRLEDIELETPIAQWSMSRWPKDRDLHWSGQVEGASDYEIAGGQTATLNVVSSDRSKVIKLAYRGTEEFRLEHKLSANLPLLILVNISNRGSIPQYAICRVDPEALASFLIQGISGREPFSLLWHGTERPKLIDYQKPNDS